MTDRKVNCCLKVLQSFHYSYIFLQGWIIILVFLIDNIFIDISKMDDYEIIPLINGLSDHNAQLIIVSNIQNQLYEHQSYFKRKINKYTTAGFKIKLIYETWGLFLMVIMLVLF